MNRKLEKEVTAFSRLSVTFSYLNGRVDDFKGKAFAGHSTAAISAFRQEFPKIAKKMISDKCLHEGIHTFLCAIESTDDGDLYVRLYKSTPNQKFIPTLALADYTYTK